MGHTIGRVYEPIPEQAELPGQLTMTDPIIADQQATTQADSPSPQDGHDQSPPPWEDHITYTLPRDQKAFSRLWWTMHEAAAAWGCSYHAARRYASRYVQDMRLILIKRPRGLSWRWVIPRGTQKQQPTKGNPLWLLPDYQRAMVSRRYTCTPPQKQRLQSRAGSTALVEKSTESTVFEEKSMENKNGSTEMENESIKIENGSTADQ